MKENPPSERSRPVMLMVGTRPEAIKLLPVYRELKKRKIPTLLCALGQHAELLDDVLRLFRVQPDFDFRIMKPNQDLFHVTEAALEKARALFRRVKPSLVIVQGDTTSAMAAALAAFYLDIPLAHVEAGLRSGNLRGPFPEELNRRFISLLATLHFAPTTHAANRLLDEGIEKEAIFCTGNTIVDALFLIRERVVKGTLAVSLDLKRVVAEQKAASKKLLLLTAHRRESFGAPLLSIFKAIKQALEENPDLFAIYPVHPNPQIQQALFTSGLEAVPNILILPPLSYPDLIYALDASDFVATDSGGILEEAASLRKPLLVLRNETDRPEAGAHLVGTQEKSILTALRMIEEEPQRIRQLPFGDGTASRKIVSILQEKGLC